MKNVILCLVFSLTLPLLGAIYTEQRITNNGNSVIRIVNDESEVVYCHISGRNYFVDFYLEPYSTSRWFLEPNGYYEWRCQ